MDKYLIYMDVSGDIDNEVAKNSGIRFITMDYSVGDEMKTCTGFETAEDLKVFYDSQRNGSFTKTSQITPFTYEEAFSEAMNQGYSVLYLCLSSGLSSTYSSACTAKESLESRFPGSRLYPLDTLSATAGMGVIAERAVANRDNGMSLEDNFNDIMSIRGRMEHWFLVQDLMYLKRGGRVSAATAVLGTALNIKPILEIDKEGYLQVINKKRGNKAAAQAILDLTRKNFVNRPGNVIYVINADAPDIASLLEETIRKEFPDVTVRVTGLSPIIGAHTGPGMAALTYLSE